MYAAFWSTVRARRSRVHVAAALSHVSNSQQRWLRRYSFWLYFLPTRCRNLNCRQHPPSLLFLGCYVLRFFLQRAQTACRQGGTTT